MIWYNTWNSAPSVPHLSSVFILSLLHAYYMYGELTWKLLKSKSGLRSYDLIIIITITY